MHIPCCDSRFKWVCVTLILQLFCCIFLKLFFGIKLTTVLRVLIPQHCCQVKILTILQVGSYIFCVLCHSISSSLSLPLNVIGQTEPLLADECTFDSKPSNVLLRGVDLITVLLYHKKTRVREECFDMLASVTSQLVTLHVCWSKSLRTRAFQNVFLADRKSVV